MNTLLINAHPQPSAPSYSQALQNHFAQAFQKLNPDSALTTLTLYESEIPALGQQVMGIFAKQMQQRALDAAEQAVAGRMKALLEQFKAHKRVVIVMPMHNFNIPARLKDYMDNILIARETFRYTAAGSEGLMSDGRKVLLLQSSGSIYTNNDRYTPLEFPRMYLQEMFCNIMGFDSFDIVRAQGTSLAGADRNAILQQAFADLDAVLPAFSC